MLIKEFLKEGKKINDISLLSGCYFSHLANITIWGCGNETTENEIHADGIHCVIHKHHQEDNRRFGTIRSYWLNDSPVLLALNGGREGDDYHRTFILDKSGFEHFISSIKENIQFEQHEDEWEDEVEYKSLDDEMENNMLKFYNSDFR